MAGEVKELRWMICQVGRSRGAQELKTFICISREAKGLKWTVLGFKSLEKSRNPHNSDG